ncbi:MAG: type IV conjugative transfer system coupling protein TraD [Oceanospirillaceae bacterium]|nr:type IV conjugative transfer system coupling protein TraD [Oceanospirillaceae bacterium]
MKNSSKQFIRGGQIFLYNMRMMVQVMNRIMKWAILGFILLLGILMLMTAHHEISVVGLNIYSKLLTLIGNGNEVVWQSAQSTALTADYYLNSKVIQEAVSNASSTLMQKFLFALLGGGLIYVVIVYYFSRFFVKKGSRYSLDKFVSGTRLAKDVNETIKAIKKSDRGVSNLKLINQIPLPMYSEKQGLFYHGSTGSGKTQAIMQLLTEIRQTGDPVVIYDKECTIKPHFFNKDTDIELNPVSKLCANWDLWKECDNPMELGNLARYLIPKSVQGSDPFWVDAARTILISMAWKIRDKDDKNTIMLLRLLLTTTLEEMRGILHGTESENLVSKEIEKTAISIKSVLATYTKALRFLEGLDKTSEEKFSIKHWIKNAVNQQGSSGWLFITSRSQYHKEIKPLISLWLGLAMQGIQSLQPDKNRRIWLVMDELASLHRLEMLSDTMADIRKFGGCVVVGIQSISQLEFLYGNQEALAIADLLNTSVYFRSPKSKVAKWVSEDLGEQVIEEVKESQSYGPDSVRDGNTIGTQRVIRKTVESGSIMTLNDLECYIRLVGDYPITRVKNTYVDYPEISEALVERDINFDALEKINQEIQQIQNHPDVSDEVKKINQFEDLSYKASESDDPASLKLPKNSQGDGNSSSHSIEERESTINHIEKLL